MRYDKYLHTPEWSLVKHKVLHRDKHRCMQCGAKINVSVHHKNYNHIFEEYDHLDDLTTLCNKCHQKAHNIGYFSSKGVTQECLLDIMYG